MSLGRNVRQSVRRAINRLAREGHAWSVDLPDDAGAFTRALDILVALHHARAELRDKVSHRNYLKDAADGAFLRDAAERMFRAGHLTIPVLRVAGKPVAGSLLLHANGSTFVSLSGSDPAWWWYSMGTLLMAQCLGHAIDHGDTTVNLSIGPDEAKLRWSTRIDLYQDFILVGPRWHSRLFFSLFWLRRAMRVLLGQHV